jgi:rubrerythrin
MINKTPLGWNRTGIATSRDMAAEMTRAAASLPWQAGSADDLHRVRAAYVANASVFGTMPPPASLKEAALDTLQLLKGNKAAVLLDELGNRLAFERTGSRLYEALLTRVEAGPSWAGGPLVEDVVAIHADEMRHFQLIKQCIERLGSDPTVITPCANVSAVASLGLVQVMSDPRIPLRYALNGILTAELTDHDGWSMLIELASSLGQAEMAAEFREALASEELHLQRVRGWLRAAILADADLDLKEEPGEQQEWYEQLSIH